MSSRTMVTILSVTMMAACAALAGDHGPRGGGPGGPGGPAKAFMHGGARLGMLLKDEEILKKAGITDAQKNDLTALFYKNREQMIELRAAREKAELKLEQAMESDEPTEEAALKAVEALNTADLNLMKAGIAEQFAVIKILGKDKMDEIRSLVRQEMMKRKGDRPRGPMGMGPGCPAMRGPMGMGAGCPRMGGQMPGQPPVPPPPAAEPEEE